MAQKIKQVTPNLKYVFDTIGNPSSSVTASQATHESGSVLCTVRPGKTHTENVAKQTKVTDVLVFKAFKKDIRRGGFHWPVSSPQRTSLSWLHYSQTSSLARKTMICRVSFTISCPLCLKAVRSSQVRQRSSTMDSTRCQMASRSTETGRFLATK